MSENSRCEWQSTKPGMMAAMPKSRTSSPGWRAMRSAAVPTSTMRSPSTSTAPYSM